MDIDTFLTDTCSVSRPTSAQDSVGGNAPTWASAGTAVPCVCRLLSARERVQGGKAEVPASTHRVYFRYGSGVQPLDRVTLSGGRVLELQVVDDPHGLHEFIQADAREV